MRSAGRWRVAARSASPTRWAPYLRALGGEIATSHPVSSIARAAAEHGVLFDLTPRQLLGIAGDRLPAATGAGSRATGTGRASSSSTGRSTARSRGAPRAARSAAPCISGRPSRRSPRSEARRSGTGAIRSGPTCCSRSRACSTRRGRPTASTPRGPTVTCRAARRSDMTRAHRGAGRALRAGLPRPASWRAARSRPRDRGVQRQLRRGRHQRGSPGPRQLFTRPTARLVPYATPARGVYICSSSTPPGGGVHGMCGYFAARAALRRELAG